MTWDLDEKELWSVSFGWRLCTIISSNLQRGYATLHTYYMSGTYEKSSTYLQNNQKDVTLFAIQPIYENFNVYFGRLWHHFGTPISSFQVERANKDLAQLDRQCLTQQGCHWLTNFCYTVTPAKKITWNVKPPTRIGGLGGCFYVSKFLRWYFQIPMVVFRVVGHHGIHLGSPDFPKGKEATSTMECGTYQEYFWGGVGV